MAAALDAASSSAAPAAADSASVDSVVLLPGIAVDRDRPLSPARKRRPTAFVSELPVRANGRAVETLSEVLSAAPGVHVVNYGGVGAFTSVMLRGAPAGQVAVYLDGVPMHSASQTVVNLSTLPTSALETVEVYRGGSPLLMGAARPGGAVHLVTREGPGASELSFARGSFDTWEARGTGGFARGNVSGWVHGSYQGTAGDFAYHDDNGTPFNPNDDETSVRRNNRFDAGTGSARIAWKPNAAWQLAARGHALRSMKGFPGIGSTPALDAHYGNERWIGQGDVTRSLAGDGRVILEGSLDRERSRFSDADGELGVGYHDTDDRFASENVAARFESPRLPFGVEVQSGVSQRTERADLHDAADGRPDPPQSRRLTRGLAVEGRMSPWRRLQIAGGQRWDRIDDELHANGLGWRIETSDVTRDVSAQQLGARLDVAYGLEVRANWSRGVRVPDFTELFGNQGAVVGNPALLPERTESRDVGAAWHGVFGRWAATLDYAHYASDAEDLIVYVRNSPSSAKAQNVSRARIRGDELALTLRVPWGFSASGAVTWQSAIDVGSVPFWYGKQLPQRPAVQSYARIEWRGGPLMLSSDVQHMGDNYLDRYNRYIVSSRTLVGAVVDYGFTSGLHLMLEGKNLGDNRVADVAGYPLPGRSLYAGVRWRLGEAGPNIRREN